MKEQKIGLNTVKFYSSAEEFPIKRFQKFNKHMMIAAEVGSTFEDYMKRNHKLMELMKKEMHKEAIAELTNQTQMAFNAYNDYSPKEMALALTVYSINGHIYRDHSSGTLEEIITKLDQMGFTQKAMNQTVSEVKKKSKRSWLNIFRRNSGKPQTTS